MAITNANFNNIDYCKVAGKRIITCSSDKIASAGVFNYRFLLEIHYGTKVYSYTFRPNMATSGAYGFINITKILQSLTSIKTVQTFPTIPDGSSIVDNEFYQSIFNAPHTKDNAGTQYPAIYSINDTFKEIELKLFDFYGATADAVPTKQTAGSQTALMYIIGGYDKESDKINVDYSDYKLTGSTKLFITSNHEEEGNYKVIRNLKKDDYGTISFLNSTKTVNASSDPKYLIIKYYKDVSGTVSLLATQHILNSTLFGGETPSTTLTQEYVLTVGCYPANLNKLPATYDRPIHFINSPVAYYHVYFATDTAGASPVSQAYRFYHSSDDMRDTGCKYDRQRFAYSNSFGVFEFITFTELRTDNISSKNTTIKGSVFDYGAQFPTASWSGQGVSANIFRELAYTPDVAHQGEKTVATDFNETFTVNTGFLSKSDTKKVEELFLSPRVVYINSDGSARSVILETSSINSIRNINKHYEQVSYSLTFRYSVPTYNNIIF